MSTIICVIYHKESITILTDIGFLVTRNFCFSLCNVAKYYALYI